jgi:hypothetical protein
VRRWLAGDTMPARVREWLARVTRLDVLSDRIQIEVLRS